VCHNREQTTAHHSQLPALGRPSFPSGTCTEQHPCLHTHTHMHTHMSAPAAPLCLQGSRSTKDQAASAPLPLVPIPHTKQLMADRGAGACAAALEGVEGLCALCGSGAGVHPLPSPQQAEGARALPSQLHPMCQVTTATLCMCALHQGMQAASLAHTCLLPSLPHPILPQHR